jgi:hypothetical protein
MTFKEILEDKVWGLEERQINLEEYTLNKLYSEIKENFDIILPDSLETVLYTKEGNLSEKGKSNKLKKSFVNFARLYQEKVIKEGIEEKYKDVFKVGHWAISAKDLIGEASVFEIKYKVKDREVNATFRILENKKQIKGKEKNKYYNLTKIKEETVELYFDDFRVLYSTILRIVFRDVVQKPRKVTVQNISQSIGKALIRENHKIKNKRRRIYNILEKREEMEIEEELEINKKAFKLGEMLLLIFLEATKLIKIEKSQKFKSEDEVKFNLETFQDFFKEKFYQRLVSPTFLPMVVEPRDWGINKRGGHFYNADLLEKKEDFFNEVFKYDLVKKNENIGIEFLDKKGAEGVFSVINNLQKIKWKVNKEVLNFVLETVEKTEIITDSIVTEYEIKTYKERLNGKQVERIKKETFQSLTKEQKIEYKELYHIQKQLKAKEQQKITETLFLSVISDFKKHIIYFAWQLDPRGRQYPVCLFSHQGTEFVRAILDFGETQIIKPDEFLATKIITYGASLFGRNIDKILKEHQIDWVNENERKIMNPTENVSWVLSAKKPFLFYRWCLEFKLFNEAYEKGKIYYSNMPFYSTFSALGLIGKSGKYCSFK